MRKILVFTALMVLLVARGGAEEFRTEVVLDGLVKVTVPARMRKLSDEDRTNKYPMWDDAVAFTDSEKTFDLAIHRSGRRVPVDGIDGLRSFMSKNGRELRPSDVWHSDELRSINGREFSYQVVTTKSSGIEVRDYLLLTAAEETYLTVKVTVPERKVDEYSEIIRRVIESLHVTRP
jgi:hypothetical protein